MLARDDIANKIPLNVNNQLTESITTHPNIKQFGIIHPSYTHVQVRRPQHSGILTHEPNTLLHKRIVMNVASTQDNSINLSLFSILKINRRLIKITQPWNYLNILRNVFHVIIHLHPSVPPCYLLRPILITLQGHILCRVTSANDQHILVLELIKLPQLMTMRYLSLE